MKNLFKKTLACCLVVCMVLTLCISALTVNAENPTGTVVAGTVTVDSGEGTAVIPVEVSAGVAASKVSVKVPANLTITALTLDTADEDVDVTYASAAEPNGKPISLVEATEFVAPYVDAEGVFSYIIHAPAGEVTTAPVIVKISFTGTFVENAEGILVDVEAQAAPDAVVLFDLTITDGKIIVKAAHVCEFVGTVTQAPTCTVPGIKTYACTCGVGTYTEEIPVIPHTEEEIPAVPATCTTAGATAGVKCSVCQEVLTAPTTVDALGHNWGEGEVTTAPDCDDAGVRTYTCANDPSHTKEEAIDALGHKEVDVDAVAPTCTETGLTAGKKCSVCGAFTVPQEEVKALGHNFGENLEFCANNCGTANPDYVAPCDHANATKTFKEKTDTAFVYTYICECGATGEKEISIGEDLSVNAQKPIRNITPTNDISMSFRFPSADMAGYTDLIAHFAKEEYAPNSTAFTIKNSYNTTIDTTTLNGHHAYKFNDIAAYEMSVNITCSVYGYDAETNTMVKITTTTYSVQQYVMDALNQYASTTAPKLIQLRTTLVDLLNYGAAVQTLRTTNVANLANSRLSDVQKAYGTAEEDYCNDSTVWAKLPDVVGVLDGADDTNKITRVDRTLITAEKVKMQFTFTEFAGDINNYYAKFDFNKVNGTPDSKTYSYADIGFTNTNGKSGFLFGDALIPTMDYPTRVTFYYGDPENGGVAVFETVFSIEAYCENFYNFSNARVANVCKTIYAYGKSMAAFVGTPAYNG